jgi:hypothetical protein
MLLSVVIPAPVFLALAYVLHVLSQEEQQQIRSPLLKKFKAR